MTTRATRGSAALVVLRPRWGTRACPAHSMLVRATRNSSPGETQPPSRAAGLWWQGVQA